MKEKEKERGKESEKEKVRKRHANETVAYFPLMIEIGAETQIKRKTSITDF